MAGRQSESKTSPAPAPSGTWLDELDLTTQTLTLYIQGGGRIKGPNGNTVSAISVGAKSHWPDATVEYCATTGMYVIKKGGKTIRTVIPYATEVN